MLREIKISRRDDPAIFKRWFESGYFDLFLWFRAEPAAEPPAKQALLPSPPFHMQLCYDKPARERAVSWRESHGYFHDGVLSNRPGDVVAKSSILEAGGQFDFTKVNARFLRESAELEIDVRKFVLEKLHHFALNGPTHPDRPGRFKVRRHGFDAPPAPPVPPPPDAAPEAV